MSDHVSLGLNMFTVLGFFKKQLLVGKFTYPHAYGDRILTRHELPGSVIYLALIPEIAYVIGTHPVACVYPQSDLSFLGVGYVISSISLTLWIDAHPSLFHQHNRNGLAFLFLCRPRAHRQRTEQSGIDLAIQL